MKLRLHALILPALLAGCSFAPTPEPPAPLEAVPETFEFPGGAIGTISRIGDDLEIDPGSGVGVATFSYTIVDSLGNL